MRVLLGKAQQMAFLVAIVTPRLAMAGDGTPPAALQAPATSPPPAQGESGSGPRIGAWALLGGAAACFAAGGYLAVADENTSRGTAGLGLVGAGFLMSVFGVYLWSNYPPHKGVEVGLSPSGILVEGHF
jgi:hypothetical protein